MPIYAFRIVHFWRILRAIPLMQFHTTSSMTQFPQGRDDTGLEKLKKPNAAELPQSDRMVRRAPPEQIEYSLSIAKAAVRAIAESRGQDIMLLNLTEQTSLFDFFLIASGSSRRQLGAMSQEIERVLKDEFGERKLSLAGIEESRWIVLDYGNLVIHLFDEETREFYDLESLWADAKPVDISDIVAAASAQMARLTD